MKYLWITFNRSLSFAHHVDNVIQLVQFRIMATANFPQRTLFLLMQTLVTSVLDYDLGLLILSNSQLTKLERIQTEAMRTVFGYTRDSLVMAMRYLLKER